MKKIFFAISFLVISFHLLASTSIKGRVVDADAKTPIEFVTVSLQHANNSKQLSGVLTNEQGMFVIPSITDGKYLLKVSYIGYLTIEKEISVGGKDILLGDIEIKENTKQLKAVEVVGQGSQLRFDIDKKVFSVDQNIAASGGSATEVLQNIPSVNVDNDGNISLRNNENVEVWINGKPAGLTAENRAQILQQMPAGSIESVEIMTNPSAKFSPEGTAGIINLVMKKNRKAGYYGSVGSGAMLGAGNKLGGSSDFSINYSNKKIETFANIGVRRMAMEGKSITNRTNFNSGDTTFLDQNSDAVRSFMGLFLRGGLDYHLNDKNTIGFSGFGMLGRANSNENVDYLQTQKSTNDILNKYSRNNISDNYFPGYNINVYHKIDIDKKGSNLITNLSYSGRNMENDNTYLEKRTIPSTVMNNLLQNSTNLNKEFEFKSDYTKKFNENDRLELGLYSNYEMRKSTSDGFNNITQTNIDTYYNDFTDNDWVNAVYATYGKKINRFSFQLGLRGEYQTRNNKSISHNDTLIYNQNPDFQLFPSMYLSYALPDNNELQLNYTRRVHRPHGRQINPFRDYSDPTMISYGNPQLMPEYASAFELNYLKNWESHSLSASAYYRFTNNVIQRVSFIENSVLQNTYMNLTKQQNTGLELVAKNRLFKILNLTSSINMYYSKINPSVYTTSENVNVNLKGQENFTWDAKMIANFMLGRTFSGQVTGQYIAPQILSQGKQFEMYSIDLGLRKTFFDRKLTLALTGRDILNSRKIKMITSGVGFTQNYESLIGGRMGGGRMIGLNVTYSFGNMKPKPQERQKEQNQNQDMNMGTDD